MTKRGWEYRTSRCAVCGRPAYFMGNGGRSLCGIHYNEEVQREKERAEKESAQASKEAREK